jgi:hypothetical protein
MDPLGDAIFIREHCTPGISDHSFNAFINASRASA